ncbi:MAG: hypothetical protein H0U50_01105 [Pyrinomonadaceae bacterium]|nr:hypothetical protein [Pyrinomonadaceae bacterium]
MITFKETFSLQNLKVGFTISTLRRNDFLIVAEGDRHYSVVCNERERVKPYGRGKSNRPPKLSGNEARDLFEAVKSRVV